MRPQAATRRTEMKRRMPILRGSEFTGVRSKMLSSGAKARSLAASCAGAEAPASKGKGFGKNCQKRAIGKNFVCAASSWLAGLKTRHYMGARVERSARVG